MAHMFGLHDVYITEDEVFASALALNGVFRSRYALDYEGNFFYVYDKTVRLEEALAAIENNTLTVKVQDFWSNYNQPGPTASDFCREK